MVTVLASSHFYTCAMSGGRGLVRRVASMADQGGIAVGANLSHPLADYLGCPLASSDVCSCSWTRQTMPFSGACVC